MTKQAGLQASDLVGTWRLLTWDAILGDGSIEQPFGEAPAGYVVYTSDGRMMTTVSQTGRAQLLEEVDADPTEARLAALASFYAYAGTFEVSGDDVVHMVEMSLHPDWVGTRQARHADLAPDGATLTLSTDPTLVAGRTARHRLRWERIRP